MNELLIEKLKWRYATKSFDRARTIPDHDWSTLEEALRLTPSSYGLQPWKFIVIRDQKTKDSLLSASYNQSQIADCSHLLVFAAKTSVTAADVDRLVDASAAARGIAVEALSSYRKVIVGDLIEGARSAESTEWAKLQSYIALGNFMTCAAMLDIDCCPMEGFVPAKYDEILGLAPRGLTTSVVCPAGYRSGDDKYATAAKMRFPKEDLFEYIG
ncbi:MAG: NAD(P)H-dependent oxidoreductase [Verrucomicrobiales bacterium]